MPAGDQIVDKVGHFAIVGAVVDVTVDAEGGAIGSADELAKPAPAGQGVGGALP